MLDWRRFAGEPGTLDRAPERSNEAGAVGEMGRVVFDLAQAGCRPSPNGAYELVVLALAVVAIGSLSNRTFLSKLLRRAFFGVAAAVSVVLAVLALAVHGKKDHCLFLKHAMDQGLTLVAEGRVANFVPMPFEGHQNERFSVADVQFEYSDYTKTPAFHNARSHGGPIREGINVRITYMPNPDLRSNDIVRLESFE